VYLQLKFGVEVRKTFHAVPGTALVFAIQVIRQGLFAGQTFTASRTNRHSPKTIINIF
jgi:hypothetical protein